MREFDADQVRELVAGPKFYEDRSERVCPACGHSAVRTYVYRGHIRVRPSLISYMWCAHCRRFKGWTGPDLGTFDFTDPMETLSTDQRAAMAQDFGGFFRNPDRLWDSGELPQRFW
ncbi:hypothetical protein ABZ446_19570 [Streptomyces sp. NPDC005813]|uniref:hypothetical protein n=1 Tax=Streptomyces sp. NPDC005813 TaxID=3155592 RepID=UPI0033F934D8